jgi:hypothetical protein
MGCRRVTGLLFVAACLAGCQGQVSVDFTNERPADASLRQVVAGLSGLEFERSDGSATRVTFTASESVNLNGFQNGRVLALLTDETLPPGTYTGIRLLFDTNADGRFVTDSLSRRFQLQLAAGDYAAFDFLVEKDKASRRDITLAQGGTVYLFTGRDRAPDDRDGIGVEPYATTALTINTATGQFSYRLLDLPAGDYTLAVTCEGSLENPATDDTLVFHGTRNVQVSEATVTTANVTG